MRRLIDTAEGVPEGMEVLAEWAEATYPVLTAVTGEQWDHIILLGNASDGRAVVVPIMNANKLPDDAAGNIAVTTVAMIAQALIFQVRKNGLDGEAVMRSIAPELIPKAKLKAYAEKAKTVARDTEQTKRRDSVRRVAGRRGLR
jgi:hypothetical protein